MREILQRLKGPLIIISILFVLFVGYNMFFKKTESTKLVDRANQGTAKSPEQELLPLLLRIQSVTLDEKIFEDPVFQSLNDFGLAIIPEDKGKRNPFGTTLGGSSSSAVDKFGFTEEKETTTTTTTTTTKNPPAKNSPAKSIPPKK